MLFIYEMRIKHRHTRMLLFKVFITTTAVCVSKLNVLLVYPACGTYKYNASEADCCASAMSLFCSVSLFFLFCVAYLILSDDCTIINQDFCAD